MAVRSAPHAQRVKVRVIATGQVLEAWPVDAREMVTHPAGGCEYVTEDQAATPPPVALPASPSEALNAKTVKELQEVAKRAGLSPYQKKSDLVDALLPHVAQGTVSLETVDDVLPRKPFLAALPQAET